LVVPIGGREKHGVTHYLDEGWGSARESVDTHSVRAVELTRELIKQRFTFGLAQMLGPLSRRLGGE